jgi:hypothetical protein
MLQFAAAQSFTTDTTTITMSTANDGSVLPGMDVFNAITLTDVGTVLTYVGTALTLTAPAETESETATDDLLFSFSSIELTAPPALELNPQVVDFPGIFNQLVADLLTNKTWTDLAATATGTALLRYMSAIGAFSQGGTARALQESFLDTARSPSGVFRAVRLQGTHIIRGIPGTVTVTCTRTDNLTTTLVVPIFQQFMFGGQNFFNTSPITLSSTGASAANIILSRGTVQSQAFTGSGLPHQRYVLGSSGAFNLSDTIPIAVDSTGQIWNGIRTGLWKQSPTDFVFYESTLPDGTIECKFGDGTYGAIPPSGTITFFYVEVDTAANTITSPTIGATGTVTGFTVNAVTTSSASPNLDPPTPDFYKNMGPGGAAVASGGGVTTRDDYRAVALEYPGIIDARFLGQAELNPSDRRYMNIIGAVLLTSTPWNQTQWLTFKQFLETIGLATATLMQIVPKPVPISISMNIACFPNANLTSISTLALNAITEYFTFSDQSLGWSFEPSDLELKIASQATYLQAPGESGELIDFLKVTTPNGPQTLSQLQYFVLTGTPNLNVFYSTRGVSAAATGQILGL